jgi:hypothetical protein
MLRWLTICGSVLLIGTVIMVARYDEIHNTEGKGYDIKCTQSSEPSTTMGSLICTAEHSQKAESGKNDPPRWHEFFTWPEGITALAVLATMFFIGWQAFLTRQAIASSDAASKIELRAYVVVNVVSGTIQDKSKNLKFGGSPLITNSGKTPAHNLRWRTNSIALRDSESGTYSFPSGEKEFGGEVLGVGQTMQLGVVHPDFYDAEDVEDIKLGENGRAFYYWGVISYDDAFGEPRITDFCHRIHFYPDPDKAGSWKVGGQYVAGRNKAT